MRAIKAGSRGQGAGTRDSDVGRSDSEDFHMPISAINPVVDRPRAKGYRLPHVARQHRLHGNLNNCSGTPVICRIGQEIADAALLASCP